MGMLTWIPDVLRNAGLVVVLYDGWQTRTTRRGGLTVKGVVCHHTATGPRTSNTNVAKLLAQGRPDLKGPLCQLGLDRDGHYWMIAAGRGNHNGYGRWGNDAIGIEAFNDGKGEEWPRVQLDAYRRGVAALLAYCDLPAANALGHRETDPGRKIDPKGIDMDAFRRRVAALIADPEDDVALTTAQANALSQIPGLDDRLARIEKRVGVDNTGADLSDEMDAVRKALRLLLTDAGHDPKSIGL